MQAKRTHFIGAAGASLLALVVLTKPWHRAAADAPELRGATEAQALPDAATRLPPARDLLGAAHRGLRGAGRS